MAYTGRTPAAAPLTSGDIPDGSVTPNDLSTGAPSWDTNGEVTTGDGLTVGRGAGNVSTNTAVGASALDANTTGASNVALGTDALGANTTASNNTAVGYQALYANTTGTRNNAVGYRAGYSISTGTDLTAFGDQAALNTSGSNNTALGSAALFYNTTGTDNTVVGNGAMFTSTTGAHNTAIGRQALTANTTAEGNTAVGYQAGYTNTTGTYNTYFGWHAGYVATGGGNSYLGTSAGYAMTTGSKNTIIGAYGGNQGGLDIRTSSNYIVLSDGDGNPRAINNAGNWAFKNNAASTASASGSGYPVRINSASADQLALVLESPVANYTSYIVFRTGTADGAYKADIRYETGSLSLNNISDKRLKTNIVDANLSEQWNKVKGATLRTFDWIDGTTTGQLGFIAQELVNHIPEAVSVGDDAEEWNPEENDKPWTLAQDKLIPTMFGALQEAMKRIETLEAKVAALETP